MDLVAIALCLGLLLDVGASGDPSADAGMQASQGAGDGTPQAAAEPQGRAQLEARVLELEQRLARLEAPAVAPDADLRSTHSEGTHTTPEGFWLVPGTDFGFKLGGYVKLDMIHDFNAIGNRYKFATQTISVPGEHDSVTTLHARESRVNFDFRGPLGGNDLRVFVEGDFFGDGNAFELRHAYGEFGGLLAGQTWTTYMDLSSRPHTLDFEGPDGEIFVRQAMVRWKQALGGRSSLCVALEGSSADIGIEEDFDGASSTPYPDLTSNLRVEGERCHVQLSGVLRYLELEGGNGAPDESAIGWGLALSGKTALGAPGRRLMGQIAYGEGSAHYNQATRGTGSDAVLDADGLETLPVLTAVAGYEHDWSKEWTSTLAYSFAQVDNRDSQPTDAIHQSQTASVNLVWKPFTRFLVGAEYLYGEREDRDGSEGYAHRIQFSFKFLF